MSGPWLLAIDTSTSAVVVAAGEPAGTLLATRSFPAEHHHGSHLLPAIADLVRDTGLQLGDLRGVIVGTGPGAFTGLRVGLATAKVLAHELGIPIVGIATSDALLAAVPGATALVLPAGPHDRTIVERGSRPTLLAGDAGDAGDAASAGSAGLAGRAGAAAVIAIDLAGRAPAAALEAGARAVAELPAQLLALGAARLAARATDDVARLVPAYVSLPRGVTTEVGEGGVAWSRDPR